jgi:hypothetical protein
MKHLLESALVITALGSGCSSDGGPPVEAAKVMWTDNGVRHSVMAPQAALVTGPAQEAPMRTFFVSPIVDGQATLFLSVHMARPFTPGDYHCGSGSDAAEMTYGVSGETRPPSLDDCVVTVYRIGVNHGGLVDYTEGAFSGSIVLGAAQHDITDGTFSAPTLGLD